MHSMLIEGVQSFHFESGSSTAADNLTSIILIGLSYKTSDISYREKVYRLLERIKMKLDSERLIADEYLFLTTCSRIEMYFVTKCPEQLVGIILSMMPGSDSEKKEKFYVKGGEALIKHLYKLGTGLDSISYGEEQILIQLREASKKARRDGSSRHILSCVFDSAVRVSSKLRKKHGIDNAKEDRSLSSLGVKFLLGKLNRDPSAILLIGNGKMTRLAIRKLKHVQVFVATSCSRLNNVAPNIKYIDYTSIKDALRFCDVVFSATKRVDYVIKEDDLPLNKAVYILDLGFPRNIDPNVGNHRNVELYNADDLIRAEAADKSPDPQEILKEIDNEAESFYKWLYVTKLSQVLKRLLCWSESVRLHEMNIAKRKIGYLTSRQLEIIDSLSSSIVSKLFFPIIHFAKDPSVKLPIDKRLELISALFDLKEAGDL